MKNSLLFLLFLTSCYFSFGQKENSINYLELNKKEKEYQIEKHVAYFIDSTRSLSFEDVKQKSFIKLDKPPSKNQSITWYKFYVTPKIEGKQLIFTPHIVDKTDVYIPYKNAYKHYEVGVLTKRKMKYDIADTTILNFLTDSIDFSKPFYFNKRLLSNFGKINSKKSGLIILTNDVDHWNYKNAVEYSYNNQFKLFLVVVFISFLLFLVNYLVTKDKNFLNYSLYLLFTSLIFINEFPSIRNFVSSIHPFLLNYIGSFTVIITSTMYFYFVIYFVDIKNDFPKIYKLAKYTIIGSLIFAVFTTLQMVFMPYFPYRFLFPKYYSIIFLIISIIIFTYLMIKPLSLAKRIVVIGSLFLIAGQILSITLSYSFFFLGAVIIEIIIFSGVVSYQNRITNNQKVLTESALEIEKNKRENLQELDTLKSKFFSNISHEFRTPLTLISGPIQQQLKKKNLPIDERNNLEMMQRNSKRLLSLVNQLLGISKIESGNARLQISKNNIILFVETLINNFTFTAKQKHLKFKIETKPTAIETWFDKDIVDKIITNLLSNAVKYTPENGEIKIIFFVEKKHFYFKIKNTGKQLSSEEIERIFDRFYQIDEHQQGTGIGLSLVKEIVTLHKGTIAVKSTKKWITFKVSLPIDKLTYKEYLFIDSSKNQEKTQIQNIDELTNQLEEKNVDPNSEKPILLIVEDNTDVRLFITSIFKNDYIILQAKNGQEGIDLAIEHVPDIVISDIMMPVKDGIELCKTLKTDERTSHIPIILLTAKAGDGNKMIGIETGADDYITKPFNYQLLVLKAQKLIEIRKKLQQRYSQEVVLKPTDISINSTDASFLNRMQKVLGNNLIESSFSVEEFSLAVGMSRMQLHRKLKALTGLTTSEFICSQRLKLAVKLLKTADVNVSQVGYSVGFNNASYFSTCFKKEFGVSPTKYAKTLSK